ncbi:hypothetical protein CVT25_005245 [Psilocybe cyanescens]|uniref:Uncharacterized protein n=1 Tax=Psilocybe cyanescens TaxID=93625 RepID=A0A409XS19_PSICY|nr:hypothetical protein CVT25_005245 [Psilocybe cyanescens]
MFKLTITFVALAAFLQSAIVLSSPIPSDSVESDAELVGPGYGGYGGYGGFGGGYPQLVGGVEHTGLANFADNLGDALNSAGEALGGLL